VIYPILVLTIFGIEIVSFMKVIMKSFNLYDVLKQKVPIAFLAACLCETYRLPANQHDLIP
jgi:hypothetical protein